MKQLDPSHSVSCYGLHKIWSFDLLSVTTSIASVHIDGADSCLWSAALSLHCLSFDLAFGITGDESQFIDAKVDSASSSCR